MKKTLNPAVTLHDLTMGMTTLNPGEMNATDALSPTRDDANEDDEIVCMTDDGDIEPAQWWWVVQRTVEYPYWLPHPDSDVAKNAHSRIDSRE